LHLAHPLGMKGITSSRRVKNDVRDAVLLADLLRVGSLPEAWIAPPPLRELRELVRYRTKLVNMRSSLKAQAHAVMAKGGILPALTDMFGPGGQVLLDEMPLGRAYAIRMESLRDLIEVYNREVTMVESHIHCELKDNPGYRAIQAIDGVDRVFGAIFVAEIGDINRFPGPAQLCSWAGLTPRHHESDTTCTAVRSPNRDLAWCVGLPSRPSPTVAAAPSSGPTFTASRCVEAPPRPASRSPADFSASSTTACATVRSVAWQRRVEPARRGRLRARERHGSLKASRVSA
jgi:transposase